MYGEDVAVSIKILSKDNCKYLSNFSCGNTEIDRYFKEDASTDETAVTYMFVDDEKDEIIGCITIVCSAIFKEVEEFEETPYSTVLSAMEIKYFSVDEDYQHIPYIKGSPYSLSHYIFIYMLSYMKELSQSTIGATKIVLYSVPTAVRFYERCRFKKFGDTMYGDEGTYVDGCVPMFFDLNGEK